MNGNGLFAGWNRRNTETGGRAARPFMRHGFVFSATTNTGRDAAQEPLATKTERTYQKVVDYAFRAVHLTAGPPSKTLATRLYVAQVTYSYWDGCSTGGRRAVVEAQPFPADFDGVVAGAPVLNFTDTLMLGLWHAQALEGAGVTPFG